MTVEELMYFCKKEIAKGNRKKVVYITNDEEANGIHKLNYAFYDNTEDFENEIEEDIDINEIVVLG